MPDPMTDDQIKHMVDRFLQWRLPSPWRPDGGISFEAEGNAGTPHAFKRAPVGTNLFDAGQATAMVRHMVEGLPGSEKPAPNPESEAKADAFHAAAVAEHGVNPFDTLTMLERWKCEAEPANEKGQVSFSRAMLDSATDALRLALEISRTEYLRAARAIRSLKALQDGATLAMAMSPEGGPVSDFLAAIHREAVRGQLAGDEITNEAELSADRSEAAP